MIAERIGQRRLGFECLEGSMWWCGKKGREKEGAGPFIPRSASGSDANAGLSFPCEFISQ